MTDVNERLQAALAERYTIERELGRGGMATVYLARDHKLDRAVALKVLKPELAHALGPERFLREITVTAKLDHPHILPLLDSGEADGFLYYVMPYVEGESLRDRLTREKQLPLDDAVQITREVADALSYAHSRGIIHRDIKPENILLAGGHARVADFGIARAITEAGGGALTETGLAIGTPAYMSPEQASGSKELDGRSDLYSLSCVLYEMLAGEPPHTGPSAQAIFAKRLSEPVPRVSVLRETVPEHVEATIARALAKAAADRFATAAGFAEALVEKRPPTASRSRRAIRAGLGRRWSAVAAALLVVVAGGYWIAQVWEGGITGLARDEDGPAVDSANRVAILPFSYRGAEAHAYLAEGMVDLLSRTLDGAGRLRTVDSRAALGVWAQRKTPSGTAGSASVGPDPEGARLVANALGVGRYVVGEIVEAGGRLRVSARLYGPGAEQPISASVEGTPDSLFGLVDDLTAQLAVGEQGAGSLIRTAAATTPSLDAMKAFLTAERLYREGRRDSARAVLDKAVVLDSTFAIAWYRLSQLAYFSGGALGRVTDFAGAALRHSGGLPWRERHLIEANWAYARGAAREADAAYRKILQTHPDDVEALFGLSLLGSEYGWLLGGPVSRPLQPTRAFLRYEPESFMGRWFLRDAEVENRNCAAADSLDRLLWPALVPWVDGVAVFCTPHSPEQQEIIQAARDGRFTLLKLAMWRVNGIAQNPRGAAEFARIVDERETTPEGRALARLQLAELELAQGRRGAAGIQFARLASVNNAWALVDEIYWLLAPYHAIDPNALRSWRDSLLRWDARAVQPVIPPNPGWTDLLFTRHDGIHPHLRAYLLGRLSARLGDHQAAVRYADELETMGSPSDAGSLVRDLSESIRAHVLAEQGRLKEALRSLESAPREVPFPRRAFTWAFTQPQERFLRAELLSQLGRHEEALWWYQSVGYRPGSVMAGPSHLRQAEMHEHLGQRDQAIEQYSRFLELWSDADAEFQPMIESAQRALRRLGQEPREATGPNPR